MSNVILSDRDNLNETIEEEQQEWLTDVLIALGVEKQALEIDDPQFDMRDYLFGLDIEIWRNIQKKTIDIYRNDKLIAQWKVPKTILIKEGRKYYYEIHLNEWALPFQFKER